MEWTAERKGREKSSRERTDDVICPSLLLAAKVVCDRKGNVHEPERAHLWEYCTTRLHSQCPLKLPLATPEQMVRREAINTTPPPQCAHSEGSGESAETGKQKNPPCAEPVFTAR